MGLAQRSCMYVVYTRAVIRFYAYIPYPPYVHARVFQSCTSVYIFFFSTYGTLCVLSKNNSVGPASRINIVMRCIPVRYCNILAPCGVPCAAITYAFIFIFFEPY